MFIFWLLLAGGLAIGGLFAIAVILTIKDRRKEQCKESVHMESSK